MTLKHLLFAGAAAAALLAPASVGSALAADDTYMCNGSVCADDQADQTRALNRQALDQAQRDNEDNDAYQRDDNDDNANSYGDRDDRYGDDDDDTDTTPYDNDTDDDD